MSEGAARSSEQVESEAVPLPSSGVFATRHDGSVFDVDGTLSERDFDSLLEWSAARKASDITIQTNHAVMADIGGDLVPITTRPLAAPEVERIVQYVYGDHGPGVLKAARDLDPSHEVRMRDSGLMRYRINATAGRIPGSDGIQITIRTLPATPIPLEHLGIEPEIINNIRPEQGLVLVTGPTGSGKSTLLSSAIRHIVEKPDANAKVVEYSSPIEYVYDNVKMPSSIVWQTEVGRHLKPPPGENDRESSESLYAYAVRNALRRKPKIIVIGETRDRATMLATMDAALTGHLLYSTMHVIGVPATVRRIMHFFPNDQASAAIDVMESLRMVVTQLLFPKVGGGQIGLREFMVFDDQARYQFLKRPIDEWPALTRKMIKEKRVTGKMMADSAWNAYEQGLLDREIYKRIAKAERDQG